MRLGVAGLRAITREVDMPPVPPDELNEAVLFQSDDVVPFPLEQTALSAKVIATFTDPDGAPTIRVLVAAAHRDLIDGVVKAVTEAGLEPTGIDLDTAALARALHDPSFTGPTRGHCVGWCGTDHGRRPPGCATAVCPHHRPWRCDHHGGDRQRPRPADDRLRRDQASARERRAHTIHEPCRPTAEAVTELVDEIQSSIRFFSSLPGRTPPERILVTGAGAQVAGFMDALQNRVQRSGASRPHRCPSSTSATCRSPRSRRRRSTRPWPYRSGSRCPTRRKSSSISCLLKWSKSGSADASYER